LVNEVVEKTKKRDCKRVWLITTNDNTPAIRFFQKRGLTLVAVHVNAFKITQQLKGELGKYGDGKDRVVLGVDDIPILHEVELEIIL
jgi:ribosomal protein S18 acetylase RimI-like enzyme